MTLSEILDTLADIGEQLAEMAGSPHFDTGQAQMIAEADKRCAQVRKELTQFDAEPCIDVADVLTAEEEGWSH